MFPGLMTDLNGPVSNWLRKHILLPATIDERNVKIINIIDLLNSICHQDLNQLF